LDDVLDMMAGKFKRKAVLDIQGTAYRCSDILFKTGIQSTARGGTKVHVLEIVYLPCTVEQVCGRCNAQPH
jgi:hypothetical protein